MTLRYRSYYLGLWLFMDMLIMDIRQCTSFIDHSFEINTVLNKAQQKEKQYPL